MTSNRIETPHQYKKARTPVFQVTLTASKTETCWQGDPPTRGPNSSHQGQLSKFRLLIKHGTTRHLQHSGKGAGAVEQLQIHPPWL